MEHKQKFAAAAGQALFLEDEASIEKYLRAHGWLKGSEQINKVEKPGEGNMNFVRRVQTDRQSIILKQARPWVEKYPQLEAPMERIQVEAQFYQLIQQDEILAAYTPRCLAWDTDNYVITLEDLGEGVDFLGVYQRDQQLSSKDLQALIDFISHLHNKAFSAGEKKSFPSNQKLKRLNHEHIFDFPYREENGFDLDSVQFGLQSLSMTYKTDTALKDRIEKLGGRYLGTGSCLIHGDYYPGSWLTVDGDVRVIDPEFGYFGLPEFDIGVMIAHMKMAQAPQAHIKRILSAYQRPKDFDDNLRIAFTGVEIMRRIIGIAQLPLALSLEEKAGLMGEAKEMLMN